MNVGMQDDTTNRGEGMSPMLTFERGLPGFPDAHHFELAPWGEPGGPFSLLRCTSGTPEFLAASPDDFFPDYAPEIDDETVEFLGLGGAEDALVLLIITVTDRADDATANLLGPLVINRHTGRGVQAVLTEDWSTRERLFPAPAASAR
jgi:flagellar assembly factor FliW